MNRVGVNPHQAIARVGAWPRTEAGVPQVAKKRRSWRPRRTDGPAQRLWAEKRLGDVAGAGERGQRGEGRAGEPVRGDRNTGDDGHLAEGGVTSQKLVVGRWRPVAGCHRWARGAVARSGRRPRAGRALGWRAPRSGLRPTGRGPGREAARRRQRCWHESRQRGPWQQRGPRGRGP